MKHICPTCGQRTDTWLRYGVTFPTKLAHIFDAIERAGNRGGIHPDVLVSMFYPNALTARHAYNALKVSINHINDKLESTEHKIAMPGRGGNYRLIQREVASG